jgi:hypothetical protein
MTREIVTAGERAAEAGFRRRVKLGVAGAVALGVLLLLVIGFLGRGSGRPKHVEPARVRFDELASLCGPQAKGSAARQKENWLKLAGKYVRWEGRVFAIEPAGAFGDGALLLRHRDGAGDPEVRLAVSAAEIEKPGVKVGARVSYSGRLADYGGEELFRLEDGTVHSAKVP